MTHKNHPEETLRAAQRGEKTFRHAAPSFLNSEKFKNCLIEREGGLYAPFTLPLRLCRGRPVHGFLTWLPLFSRTIFRLPPRQIAVTSSKIRLYVLIYRKNLCEIVCLSVFYRMFVSINAYVYFHITVLRSTPSGYVPFSPYSSGQLHAPVRRILRNALAENAGKIVFTLDPLMENCAAAARLPGGIRLI